MPKEIRISTILVWFAVQTIVSIIFYLNDDFVSGIEALITFVVSIPLTYLIQKLRDLKDN